MTIEILLSLVSDGWLPESVRGEGAWTGPSGEC